MEESYVLGHIVRYSWLVEQGQIINFDKTLLYHPDDYIKMVQYYWGADQALTQLKPILYDKIDAIFGNHYLPLPKINIEKDKKLTSVMFEADLHFLVSIVDVVLKS